MAATEDEFKVEDLWSFPPFFTLQIVDDTRRKQLEHWKTLIVDWHATRKKTVMTVAGFPLFENKAIGRKLSDESTRAVLDFVVESGHGEWEDESRKRIHIFYRSLQDWAATIYDYVTEHAMVGSVHTVFELLDSEEYEDAAFHTLDNHTLVRALSVLAKQGKAELMVGSGGDAEGVKFLSGVQES